MAKKFRLIPSVLYKSGSVVKSVEFQNHRVVGDLTSTMRVFSKRQADELIIFDLDAAKSKEIDWGMVDTCVKNSNMPLCYGGGVANEETAVELIGRGFDKICFNTSLFEAPRCGIKTAELIGSSSIVASIDLKLINGILYIFTKSGTKQITPFNPPKLCKYLDEIGVGELIVNRIDCEGTMTGYNFSMLEELILCADIPVIISGGCRGHECIINAHSHGFDGAVMSSIFLWQGDSIPSLKKDLIDLIPVRVAI